MRRPTLSVLAVVFSTACGPQQVADPAVLEPLNEELTSKSLQEALSNKSRYEPLCDGEGYPLVGNIASKGGTTASTFCHAAQGGRR